MNRKELIIAGGFNEELRSMHEYDVALRMARCGMRIITAQTFLVWSHCHNNISRKYFFVKFAELFDFIRCYGEDMKKELGIVQMLHNAAKTIALLSLYTLGYIMGGCVWRIIFKFKERYQKC